jgi:hypothetical protein
VKEGVTKKKIDNVGPGEFPCRESWSRVKGSPQVSTRICSRFVPSSRYAWLAVSMQSAVLPRTCVITDLTPSHAERYILENNLFDLDTIPTLNSHQHFTTSSTYQAAGTWLWWNLSQTITVVSRTFPILPPSHPYHDPLTAEINLFTNGMFMATFRLQTLW